MNSNLGKTIRILRQAKNLTVSEAARRCKVSPSFLSLVESGARQPSISVLRRMANALGIPSETLVLSAMGDEGKLVPSDKDVSNIAAAVKELLQIEDKLRSLLMEKENQGGTQRRNTGQHRSRYGA